MVHARACYGHHQGVIPKYEMQVQKKYRMPMGRQIGEGVMIEMSVAEVIMNSKGEWNGSRIPRLVVEVGEKVLTADHNEEVVVPNIRQPVAKQQPDLKRKEEGELTAKCKRTRGEESNEVDVPVSMASQPVDTGKEREGEGESSPPTQHFQSTDIRYRKGGVRR